jgi:parvulin-like peptidyl-prolyl isomerase
MQRPLIVLAVLFASLFTTDLSSARAEVLVTVNGEELTDGDLEFLYLSRRIPKESRDTVRERYVEMLVDRALLKQFLNSRKLTASKLLIDQHVARVEKLIKREGLDTDEVLKSLGFTRKTFREEVALPLTWKAHVGMVVTKQALEKFWERQKSHFDGTEVRAAHIVKKIPDGAADADIEAIKKSLATLREEIASGKSSFADAAKKNSESPSAEKGGDLGSFPYSGQMPVEFSRVAFALKAGEVSAPFQTRFGIHILTVTEVQTGDLTLEDARPEIFEYLAEEMRQTLIRQLRAKAKIERAKRPVKATSTAAPGNE